MPGLLGVRLRSPVLPTVFDFAVAAAVVLTDKLQEPAAAAGGQVKTTAPCSSRRLSPRHELARKILQGKYFQANTCRQADFVTAAPSATAGSEAL